MNTITETIDYAAVTARGAVVRTFASRELARAWVAEQKEALPGLHVVETTTTVVKRIAYRPQIRRVA